VTLGTLEIKLGTNKTHNFNNKEKEHVVHWSTTTTTTTTNSGIKQGNNHSKFESL
jgi:hypothetical protein